MLFNMAGIGSGSSGGALKFMQKRFEYTENTRRSQYRAILNIPKAGKYLICLWYHGYVKSTASSTTYNQVVASSYYNAPTIDGTNMTYEYANPNLVNGWDKCAAFIVNATADNAIFRVTFNTPFSSFSSQRLTLYTELEYWYESDTDVDIGLSLIYVP